MEKKLSIIIPAYNCSNYIEFCLNSVLNQSWTNFEVIVVDDCSTDGTGDILDSLAQENDSLLVIHKTNNEGVSSARNTGIEKATGDYLLFVDADDAISKTYAESLIKQMEATGSSIGCFKIMSSENEDVENLYMDICAERDGDYIKYNKKQAQAFFSSMAGGLDTSAIGGKMFAAKAVGKHRFEAQMKYGEDTLFLHEVLFDVSGQNPEDTVYILGLSRLYIYRKHKSNAIVAKYATDNLEYLNWNYRIAEKYALDYEKSGLDEHRMEAVYWLDAAMTSLEKRLENCGKKGNIAVKNKLIQMTRLKAFTYLPKKRKCGIYMRIRCQWLFEFACKIKKKSDVIFAAFYGERKSRAHRAGILTFHCSDNFGAQLQAYGLKQALNAMKIRADIINYCPVFMTGRHFFVPYLVNGTLKERLKMTRWLFAVNKKNGLKNWKKQRLAMARFRKNYVRPAGFAVRTLLGLKGKRYGAYVLGSDQIWNPDITGKLRKAYFGPIRGTKAVAYAASFGGQRLQDKYIEEFKGLASNCDAIGLREKSALPFVRECLPADNTEIRAVCDPVFLVSPDEWYKISYGYRKEEKGDYILVYLTESNATVEAYVKKLSEATGLRVIRLARTAGKDMSETVTYDISAGPGEFLAYIHDATYVVTNSFHATAFSIIMKKKMAIATHSNRGARLNDLLENTGLTDRVLNEESVSAFDIDKPVDWTAVCKAIADMRYEGRGFLKGNLSEFRRM